MVMIWLHAKQNVQLLALGSSKAFVRGSVLILGKKIPAFSVRIREWTVLSHVSGHAERQSRWLIIGVDLEFGEGRRR